MALLFILSEPFLAFSSADDGTFRVNSAGSSDPEMKLSEIMNSTDAQNPKIKLSVLVMPCFEVGSLEDDVAGEAQLIYQRYFIGADEFPITSSPSPASLYVKDGLGLFLLGQGKLSASVNLTMLLSDPRFDFSETLFIVSGCCGGSFENTVPGDVVLVTSVFDYDMGHHTDIREGTGSSFTWFPEPEYTDLSRFFLNRELLSSVANVTKTLDLRTTERAVACMERNFPELPRPLRDPKVIPGSAAAADNYWKGIYDHEKAKRMAEVYECPDEYAVTDMEDSAVAFVLEKFGMLDRLIIFRACVNVDVYIDGATPESAWEGQSLVVSEDGFDGFSDIFPVAMENELKVVSAVIEELRK